MCHGSQGYVTASISVNGINAQDHSENDGGAGTRADLVRRHLTLLTQWNRGTTGPRGTENPKDRLKLSRVVSVGHSRGGEGVSRARSSPVTPAPCPPHDAGLTTCR